MLANAQGIPIKQQLNGFVSITKGLLQVKFLIQINKEVMYIDYNNTD